MLMHAEMFYSGNRRDSGRDSGRNSGDNHESILRLARKLEHDALAKPGIAPVLKAFMLRQAEERYRYLGDERSAERLHRIIDHGFSDSGSRDLNFVRYPGLEAIFRMMNEMNKTCSSFGMYSIAVGTGIIAMEMMIADNMLKMELDILKRH